MAPSDHALFHHLVELVPHCRQSVWRHAVHAGVEGALVVGVHVHFHLGAVSVQDGAQERVRLMERQRYLADHGSGRLSQGRVAGQLGVVVELQLLPDRLDDIRSHRCLVVEPHLFHQGTRSIYSVYRLGHLVQGEGFLGATVEVGGLITTPFCPRADLWLFLRAAGAMAVEVDGPQSRLIGVLRWFWWHFFWAAGVAAVEAPAFLDRPMVPRMGPRRYHSLAHGHRGDGCRPHRGRQQSKGGEKGSRLSHMVARPCWGLLRALPPS